VSQPPTWALALFAAGGVVLMLAFWIWTTRKNNTKGK